MKEYEYAVIRFVPKVERGEFINIGVLLYCKTDKKLYAQYFINFDKLAFYPTEVDHQTLKRHIEAYFMVAKGQATQSPINSLPCVERFRWLTAVKSSCIQTSAVHVGLSENVARDFEQIMQELVY